MMVSGNVIRTNTRQVNTARGSSNTFSLLVDTGQEEKWFNFGFTQPKCNEGDRVEFETKQNGQYVNGLPESIKVMEASSAPDPKENPGRFTTATPIGNNNNNTRQDSIVRQSSTKHAIMALSSLLEAGAVTLPAKKADKMEAYLALVDDIADRFFLAASDPMSSDAVRGRLYGIEAQAQGQSEGLDEIPF